MDEPKGIDEWWRRAMAANVVYYKAWGDLAGQWLRGLGDAAKALNLPSVRLPELRLPLTADRAAAQPQPPATTTTASRLLLEAAGDERASASFLLENHLAETVDVIVEASPVVDGQGRSRTLDVSFTPSVFTLGPSERAVVHMVSSIPADLAIEVDYLGELRVPGIPGTTVPFVVRRIPSPP